jgi:hypothetical protein
VTVNWKDTATGLIFIVVGAWFVYDGWDLDHGTAARMGPGYFPPILASILILLGLAIAVRGIGVRQEAVGVIAWRGLVFTLAAPVIFGATVQGLGLVPSLGLATFCSALASRRMTLIYALAISVCLTIFCVAVFSYGLGLPVRLVGPWLQF